MRIGPCLVIWTMPTKFGDWLKYYVGKIGMTPLNNHIANWVLASFGGLFMILFLITSIQHFRRFSNYTRIDIIENLLGVSIIS